MNIVRTISTVIQNSKRIVKFLRYGLKNVETAPEVSPYGTDSNPIKDMEAIYAETEVRGRQVIIGYVNKQQLAEVGEHRIFSTDKAGMLKAFIWLKADGKIQFKGSTNHLTQYEALKTAFDQLKSDFNSFVSVYNTHVHSGVQTGAGVTGTTPATGTSSSADMSGAKLDDLLTP